MQTHIFKPGNFGPTYGGPLCAYCGLSEQATTHAQTQTKAKAGHTPLTKAEADSAFDGRENHVSNWPYRDLKRELAETKAQRDLLLGACQFLFGAIEDGTLVRDISRDGQSDYIQRMMRFTVGLQQAQLAIAKATEGQPKP